MLTVSRLSIAHVRGLRLHHPAEVHLGRHGVADDRRFLLLTADGRVFDGTKLGTLVQIQSELHSDPEHLGLTFPDGSRVADEVTLDTPMTVTAYGRSFAARPVIGPWADAISAFAETAVTLVRVERMDGAMDRHPVSIVSDASVQELGRHLEPERRVDARRFRMLLEVAGASPHEEDEWLHRDVRIGGAVVRVSELDARCVITTQDPETGVRDIPTLHAIKSYRGLRDGRHLDFGVYAGVVEPGVIRVGDSVNPL
ncbi:MAG: MOSC domain-containing protein [Chloroflexota bacterium]|nr:MOSC domain-containing protein [Chloroflexota bacterium]